MPLDTGGQIRFMSENLLNTGVKKVDKSSEDPNFPYSNALNNFRSRPMKFTGRFQVISTNNTIYFYSAGINYTATIASAEYQTRAAVAIAIQTALNAQLAGWTVTWNSTERKFSFTGPIHFFYLDNPINAAWDLMGFVSVLPTAYGTIRFAEEPRMHYPYEFITWDFGYHPEMGFFALIADSSKPLNISSMANIVIEASNTAGVDNWATIGASISISPQRTDKGIFQFFDDGDYRYRFWRLRIEDNFSPNEIEIGNLYLGEFNKFKEHYNDQGASVSSDDRSYISESESGQVYAFLKAKQKTYDGISMKYFNPDDKDFLSDIFDRYGIRAPFYVSVDPKLEISNSLDDTTFFCKFVDAPKYTHVFGNLYNSDFKLKEWL